ncbi:MAG: hypothetical protein P8Z35_23395, partial [Ignavibacteriaceae bacterium]
MNAKFNKSPVLRHTSNTMTTSIIISVILIVAAFNIIAVAQTVEDSVSVYEFVEAYQQTINTHDPVALAAFFTEDADF